MRHSPVARNATMSQTIRSIPARSAVLRLVEDDTVLRGELDLTFTFLQREVIPRTGRKP
jgi:hypothetical protein